jgi:predicted ribosome-associated RNA-binding protein Tma20
MKLTNQEAQAWLDTHQTAYNTGAWEPIMSDYTDDCVLEVHLDGAIMLFNGRDEILPALQMGSASGLQTTVQRVVVDEDTIGMQICDPTGATFMTSFWELEGRRIKRDVTIICQLNPPSSRTSA